MFFNYFILFFEFFIIISIFVFCVSYFNSVFLSFHLFWSKISPFALLSHSRGFFVQSNFTNPNSHPLCIPLIFQRLEGERSEFGTHPKKKNPNFRIHQEQQEQFFPESNTNPHKYHHNPYTPTQIRKPTQIHINSQTGPTESKQNQKFRISPPFFLNPTYPNKRKDRRRSCSSVFVYKFRSRLTKVFFFQILSSNLCKRRIRKFKKRFCFEKRGGLPFGMVAPPSWAGRPQCRKLRSSPESSYFPKNF